MACPSIHPCTELCRTTLSAHTSQRRPKHQAAVPKQDFDEACLHFASSLIHSKHNLGLYLCSLINSVMIFEKRKRKPLAEKAKRHQAEHTPRWTWGYHDCFGLLLAVSPRLGCCLLVYKPYITSTDLHDTHLGSLLKNSGLSLAFNSIHNTALVKSSSSLQRTEKTWMCD